MNARSSTARLVADEGISVVARPRSIVVRLGAPHRVLSWAIEGGGLRIADTVTWIEVRNDELAPHVDPRQYLQRRLAELGTENGVGMLTSRTVATFEDVTASDADVTARCIATVGLGNALRAGDPSGLRTRVGTINLLAVCSEPLDDAAMLEAMSIAVEARTTAIFEANVPSRQTGLRASGTGTDCVVIASPMGKGARYAGKHTSVGAAIGAAVFEAVAVAAAAWKVENGR